MYGFITTKSAVEIGV